MRFAYTIEITPSDTSGYHPLAFTEGTVEVWQGNRLFLRAEGILLVELAIDLERWRRRLEEGVMENLYYVSMDFEEEPIFALFLDSASGEFTPRAVWSECDGAPVSPSEANVAILAYIESLRSDLAAKGIDLEMEIENAIDYMR